MTVLEYKLTIGPTLYRAGAARRSNKLILQVLFVALFAPTFVSAEYPTRWLSEANIELSDNCILHQVCSAG